MSTSFRSSKSAMLPILTDIAACRHCAGHLAHLPRPVVAADAEARLLIVGQAPGRRVHDTGIPWNDPSGALLREWLQLAPDVFYDAQQVAIVPMGFCYPGKGSSGDLPPRPECAPRWHGPLLAAIPKIRLTLLIGRYAQAAYLGTRAQPTLTETVAHFDDFLPRFFPLPHPSPRNRLWLRRNPWFADKVLPRLREEVAAVLS
jgi:uracil-DNA glycosylase